MSKAEHTPGPWIVKYNDQHDHIFTQATPHKRIANVFGGVFGNNEADLEHQANARLIAAAPDLLAALKRLCETKDEDLLFAYDAWEAARAAITRACE